MILHGSVLLAGQQEHIDFLRPLGRPLFGLKKPPGALRITLDSYGGALWGDDFGFPSPHPTTPHNFAFLGWGHGDLD